MSSRIFMVLLILSQVSCASFGRKLKAFLNGGETSSSVAAKTGLQGPSFSTQSNLNPAKERKYRRVTKENFSDTQLLEENSGSLWQKIGQGSFLFSQNNLRMMGDIVNVEVEGKAAENLQAKVNIIKRILARYEPPALRRAPARAAPPTENKSEGAPAGGAPGTPTPDKDSEKPGSDDTKKEQASDGGVKFDNVPCRIVEKNIDGSYRIKGYHPVYVGIHEYKLLVTGVVRPDDIATDKVTSSKLIDSKFDLVASNKEVKP